MARYTGPKHKLARREGVNILDKTSASLQRRLNIPPGVHGRKLKRRMSEFGQQLREKQKAKAMYGLLEKQFKKLVEKAANKKGDTGENLVGLLETRLDNVVYRLGFARSRYMARQFVSHGHIFVNDKKLSIASYSIKPEDSIKLSAKMKDKVVKEEETTTEVLSFFKVKNDSGTLLRLPTKEDVTLPFDLQLIIEYYSR